MRVAIKRARGLGNVLLLLPAIDALIASGAEVELITREEFIPLLRLADLDQSRLRLSPITSDRPCDFDLDAWTRSRQPSDHRVMEFANHVGATPLRGFIPISADPPAGHADAEYCVLAPEAGHAARQWSASAFAALCAKMASRAKVYVVGTRAVDFPLSGVQDLRGQTSLIELASLLRGAAVVFAMDSGVMHLAACVGAPTVAMFGSVDPRLRMANYCNVHALVPHALTDMPNKNVALEAALAIDRITPDHVAGALVPLLGAAEPARSRILLAEGQSELRELHLPPWGA